MGLVGSNRTGQGSIQDSSSESEETAAVCSCQLEAAASPGNLSGASSGIWVGQRQQAMTSDLPHSEQHSDRPNEAADWLGQHSSPAVKSPHYSPTLSQQTVGSVFNALYECDD